MTLDTERKSLRKGIGWLYRQISVYMRKNAKLLARFFGPFKIIKKISPVAYELELPKESRIHLVFHVSLLKKKVGGESVMLAQLPEMDENAQISPTPQAVLETRTSKKKIGLLVHWHGLSPSEVTWEN